MKTQETFSVLENHIEMTKLLLHAPRSSKVFVKSSAYFRIQGKHPTCSKRTSYPHDCFK